ncbi:multidrug DMT transporter [Deinococcus koreensis]|uniref:Multidrug DMT transporter n=1 Tax=Deinococcus koreensis TaxID=2054903 RepID=A0A2K3UZR6_9DEIO|nr:multidrug DMT transporter [Deinococcus koreensis]PNY82036.1 multidrug DMT transporter [Deinococcus koreensis]
MDTLKKAGAMLAHLDLFQHMLNLRSLLQLAAHMEERGDRVTLISQEVITLVGQEMSSDAQVTTSKGASIQAGTAYRVLQGLKGHEAPEYAVTREELSALNTRAVADLESSDALRAFSDTLTRISAAPSAAPTSAAAPAAASASPAAPSDPAAERPTRTRRAPEGETTDQPAA